MRARGLLNFILGAVLLVLLVAVQVQSAPAEQYVPTSPVSKQEKEVRFLTFRNNFDRRDIALAPGQSLDTRGLSGIFKKFKKSKKGTCDECDLAEPQGIQGGSQTVSDQTSSALEKLYGTIKGVNLVKTGGTVHVSFDPKTAALYGASDIYGCTVVVVLDGQGAVIGHYPQEYGNVITMNDASATQKKIITPLEAALDLIDFTTQTQAYIVHSSTEKSIGYNAIVQALTENDMPKTNIHSMPYTAGLSTVGHRGKVVVQWELKEDGGARLKLYVQNEEPVYVRDFDKDKNPCTEI